MTDKKVIDDFKNRARSSLALLVDRVLYQFVEECDQQQIEAVVSGEKDEKLMTEFLNILKSNYSHVSAEEISKISAITESNPSEIAPGIIQSKNGHSC
jgi:hypothetical protein